MGCSLLLKSDAKVWSQGRLVVCPYAERPYLGGILISLVLVQMAPTAKNIISSDDAGRGVVGQ